MKRLGLVLGAAAVATLAGCKDPNFVRGDGSSRSEVKKVQAKPAVQKPAPQPVVVPQPAPVVVQQPVVQTPPEPVAPPPAVVEPETTEYIVQPGDYLARISRKYNVKISAIKSLNNLSSDKIRVGQKLKLPGKIDVGVQKTDFSSASAVSGKPFKAYDGATATYTVKSGDYLGKIASAHGITVRQLKALNKLDSDVIRIGQKLKVPAGKTAKAASAAKPVSTEPVKPVVKEKADAVVEPVATPANVPADQGNADAAVDAVSSVTTEDAPVADVQSAASEYKTYTVKEGETVNDISASWGLVPDQIRELNNLSEDGEVQSGQIIKLPASASQE